MKTSGQLQTKNLQLIHKQIRKNNSNTTLKIVIKPQEERTREEGKKKKSNKNKSKAINKMAIRTYISISTLNAVLVSISKTWKQRKCPSTEEWIKKMW